MRDAQKTRKQLLNELHETRQQLELLAAAEVERKQAGAELRQSEEKFYKAFLSSPDMIIITSIKDGKYIEVNESFAEITGYNREELIGHTVDEFNLFVNPAQQERMTRVLQERGSLKNEEFSFRVRSGEIRQWLCSAQIINIDGDTCMIAVAVDITESKKMEQALRDSEEKFSKVFRASPEIISITRLSDGTYLDVNDSFTRVNGYTREETIGRRSSDMNVWIKPGDRENMVRHLKELGRISNEEYLLRTKSGEIRTVLFSAEQIEYEGESCILAVTNDITDYKRMEAQALEAENLREVDKLRTELLANVSHELRTPLASIKGFATMLIDYDKRLKHQEKLEYLETIDKNADRLVELIEQLLEMSRLEAGMLSIRKTPANIIVLCQTVIAEARVRALDHKFILDLPRKLPQIDIDDRRIRQVLDNIIDNAVKYSDAGTEIALSVRKTGPELLFTVTDHGMGISKNDLPRVFERMFHSPRRQKSGVPGAGLGLAICKALVKAHGGKIWIESEEGIGTRCFFTLPLQAGPVISRNLAK